MHMDGMGGLGGGGEHERSRHEKEVCGVWVRRQIQFVVAESICHLLMVISEWTSGDWCAHVTVYVCLRYR